MKNQIIILLISIVLCSYACESNTNHQQSDANEPIDTLANKPVVETSQSDSIQIEEVSKLPTFKLAESTVFKPQNKKIAILEDSSQQKLILFQTDLQVNTDGTPLSYHPLDLGGQTKAINNIGNAVAVYKEGVDNNIFLKRGYYAEAKAVFQQYIDSNYEEVPHGYKIKWQNVLIPTIENGVEKPCIFKTGAFKGYYGSATSLKNGLRSNKGECNCNDQVNPLKIPGFVLVGGRKNPLWENGARKGDLLIAYNPDNGVVSSAIINDVGPRKKLGEASVLLNMQMNKRNKPPENYKEAKSLVTKDIIIAIIPKSNEYKTEKPYTAENIKKRISSWLVENDFGGEEGFVKMLKENEMYLR